MDLTIAEEPFDSADARRLIAELDAHLARFYPPEQRFGPNLKPEHLDGGRGVFLVARQDGRAVGCGAIRMLDGAAAEAKRMYVDPALRGQGVGRAILEQLEAMARERGARSLVLETGVHQAPALALYRRAGFKEVDCWGEYATSPSSICMEKTL
ncbi:MAG TPA: GNAT family N-acetyltransferase [Candidatus Dormibacteraeota bacterium]